MSAIAAAAGAGAGLATAGAVAAAGDAGDLGVAAGAVFGVGVAAGLGGMALVAGGLAGEAFAGGTGGALALGFVCGFAADFAVGLVAGFVAGFAASFGAAGLGAALAAVFATGLAVGFALAGATGAALAVVRVAVLRGAVAVLPRGLAAGAEAGRRSALAGFGFVAALPAAFGLALEMGRAVFAAGFATDFEAGRFAVSFVVRPLFDWAVAFITLPARSSSRVSATPALRRTDPPFGWKAWARRARDMLLPMEGRPTLERRREWSAQNGSPFPDPVENIMRIKAKCHPLDRFRRRDVQPEDGG